jgi:hypothetical protein
VNRIGPLTAARDLRSAGAEPPRLENSSEAGIVGNADLRTDRLEPAVSRTLHVEPPSESDVVPKAVECARQDLIDLGSAIEQDAIEDTPDSHENVMRKLGFVQRALHKVGRYLKKKLRLDDAILETQAGVSTGFPGFAGACISPVLAFSGADTGNKPVILIASPSGSVQGGAFTGAYAYVPGTKRPHAISFGLGPFKYKLYDPIHRSPLVGLSIPLIASVSLGPKTFGMSLYFPIPWVPVVQWGGGVWLTHPWLEPICGAIWKAGEWLATRTKSVTAPARGALRPYVHKTVGAAKRALDGLWNSSEVKKFRGVLARMFNSDEVGSEIAPMLDAPAAASA